MNNLKEILNNPNDKLIAVDLDGTLCKGEFWGEGEPEPIQHRIDFVNELYKKGGHIIIWTARMPEWYHQTQLWLQKHRVSYHGIIMREKIGADLYIDDKSLNAEELDKWSRL
jgi:uncharacterized HAD superfamily protein